MLTSVSNYKKGLLTLVCRLKNMKDKDLERLRAICEKEGFEVIDYGPTYDADVCLVKKAPEMAKVSVCPVDEHPDIRVRLNLNEKAKELYSRNDDYAIQCFLGWKLQDYLNEQ